MSKNLDRRRWLVSKYLDRRRSLVLEYLDNSQYAKYIDIFNIVVDKIFRQFVRREA